MHVQPEAKKVKIGNRPLWAAGAPQAIEDFIATRGGDVRILEFGSGASTIFLLRRGATVVTVEHHEEWAAALQEVATARRIARNLTILRRDRPYYDVPAEFPEGTTFDILLVDGRERVDCFRNGLPLVKPDGLVLLDDSQRDRYWPAFRLLAGHACTTYESKARNTTIWSLGDAPADPRFIRKTFRPAEPPTEPRRDSLLVPAEYLTGSPLELDYVQREPITNLTGVAADLQAIGLIEKEATYLPPSVYRLENSSLRLEAGHKFLRSGDAVFKARGGSFIRQDDAPPFEGAVELPGLTLDLTSSGAGRYSFFLLDSLPKLELLRAAGHAIEDFDTILINSGAHWLRELLALATGKRLPNVVAFSAARPSFKMERSVHIAGLRSARFTPRWIHDYLDRTLHAQDRESGETFGPYVYISRQKASGRQIVNHDAFLELTTSLGFTEVYAEDYSPVELASRLRDAKVLVSPHGAGLVNLILAPASTKIVELFSSHFTPQYFHLARDRGQEYHAFACVDASGQNVFDRYTAKSKNKAEFNREDIVVPIDAFAAMLAPLMEPDSAGGAKPAVERQAGPDRDPTREMDAVPVEQPKSWVQRLRFW